ncbi:MAG: DUF2207 domain-containing protein [Candidatus Saccharibacteria bacterium]|nr:DUF2207 domain-containing protein [Candidatus Saccharibacteria bacterium]
MKKWVLGLIVGALSLIGMPVHADVHNFYFSDFTGDYYLTKDAEGVSHLKVVENMTAVFPDYNQNKGICRQIPFTNQDNHNVTLPSLTRENIKVLRNGEAEPIYSIERENNYYDVCTGTEEYLLGEQVYTFEYSFEKVVTDFGDYQELYWDTNGNGWRQRFDQVTARVHFDEQTEADYADKQWCYVGKYKESGQSRCKISELDDGLGFTAQNLVVGENLTFDIELKPGSFVVPEPEENYVYVWLAVAAAVIAVAAILWKLKKYLQSREKANYYKGIFVAPQYQPSKDYSLPELAEIYLGKKKDAKVAMLLELAVGHKINFVKGEKKKWSIEVKNLDGVGEEYMDLLAILNDGTRPAVGDTIEIKRRSASNRLITLRKSMESKILGDLKKDKLVEDKYNIGGSSKRGVANIIVTTIITVLVVAMIGLSLMEILDEALGPNVAYGQKLVFYGEFYPTMLVMIIVTMVICTALGDATQKYANHTKKGLDAVRYMEGLELYIGMAEAERMKFLQSVDGADVSTKGIVKLYEKLLPYAAVFGLEESWMSEMKEYCKVEEIEEPNYLMTGLAASEIARGLHNAANYATTATVMSSSGGGSSSGFSGGGGGGFSGGGGGGGGGGGR